MTALYLLLTLCTGPACHTERLPMPSLMVCMLGAQQIAAQHWPGKRLARWRCESGERA